VKEYLVMKNRNQIVFATALLAFIPAMLHAQAIAIRAGKLVNPESASVAVNQTILIEGQTIKSVGPDLKIPDNATVIDLSKQTVLPGMFDAHAHLCITMLPHRDPRNGQAFFF
jgi:imidazolonepropionase-like amidohydrolase